MTIFFDHQIFSQQLYGGISRYYTELITAINQTPDDTAYLSLLATNNVYLRKAAVAKKPLLVGAVVKERLRTINYLNSSYTRYNLRRTPLDVFHPTYYDPYFLPYLKGRPFVVTFHDMIHEKFGSTFKELGNSKKLIAQKRVLAERATRIIAVSENTKKDVIEILQVDPAKIDVIYHSYSFYARLIPRFKPVRPYLLFVGNRGSYKNFTNFLRASATVLIHYDLTLICAGRARLRPPERDLIRQLDLTSRAEHQPITDDTTLQKLYESALAFVYPSLYEGFGIPVLEAFACNCPCVLSHTGSLPEIAATAALYFDPDDGDSIASAVERVVSDEKLRHQLAIDGSQRLAYFSWERTVRETMRVYQTCMN